MERLVEIADLPEVVADGELLRQAFLNLCVNAVQAMQPRGGGTLVARAPRATPSSSRWWTAAPGMEQEIAAHVFDPFFTTKANGTGLGLAIVRQAAEAHGGAVEVESAPGHGATFRIRLPPRRRGRRVEGGDRRDAARGRWSGRARGAHVAAQLMVIDDLESARQMMKRTLGRSYAVFDFPSVAEALPAVERAEFDAIVTDLRMPGIDGIEGMRRFKAKVPESRSSSSPRSPPSRRRWRR